MDYLGKLLEANSGNASTMLAAPDARPRLVIGHGHRMRYGVGKRLHHCRCWDIACMQDPPCSAWLHSRVAGARFPPTYALDMHRVIEHAARPTAQMRCSSRTILMYSHPVGKHTMQPYMALRLKSCKRSAPQQQSFMQTLPGCLTARAASRSTTMRAMQH
jgi:hypothetical protein